MILITRPLECALETQLELSKHNIASYIEPLIKFKSYTNKKIIYDKETVILTSKNAVRAIIQRSDNKNYKKIIAIGNKTAEFANIKGLKNIIPVGNNVKDLINYIIKHCYNEKLLYLSAKEISYPLDKILSKKGFAIKRVTIYEMTHSTQLSKKCIQHLVENQISGITFLSLNTGKIFIKLISQHNLGNFLQKINAYSLSKSISKYLEQTTWKNLYFPTIPTHKHLIDIIIISK